MHGLSARTWCYLVRHHERLARNGYGHANDPWFRADRLRTRHGFPCSLTCRLGCNRDPAPILPNPNLTQGYRLCDPSFEAWSRMPLGMQPGSCTKTSPLDIWPRGTPSPLILLFFEKTSPGVPHHSSSCVSFIEHTSPGVPHHPCSFLCWNKPPPGRILVTLW